MERFAVVDYFDYNDGEILGFDLPADIAEELRNERIAETDGECDISIFSSEFDKEIYEDLVERILD